MVAKKLKDINVGEILYDDIYRTKDALNASKEIPIITKGTPLTKNIVQKLINMFGENYEVMIFCEQNISKKLKNDNSTLNQNNLSVILNTDDYFSIEKAIEIYTNTIFQKKIYKHTKERLISIFSQIDGILQDFKTTHRLKDSQISAISRRLVDTLVNQTDSFDPTLIYLVELENWDNLTFNHSFDVGVIALAFASSFTNDLEELASLFIAGLIHDIGKFLYAKYDLNDMDYIIKKDGRLTDDEFEQVKKHVEVSDFINPYFTDFLPRYRENIIYGALEHHEKFTGLGYSKGKQGMNISYAGRIIALCDVYDALIRERRYKGAMKPCIAMENIRRWAEAGQFDPNLFKRFIKAFGKYPVGSVVTTNKGNGIVVEQTTNHERPIVFFPDSGELNSLKDKTIIFEDININD